jgi:hypothetical protein
MSAPGELGNLGEPPVSLSTLPEEQGYRLTKSPGVGRELPATNEPVREHKPRKQTGYWEASGSEATPAGSLSGAQYRRRWGTEAQRTHWREGDAGHTVRLGG